MLLLMALFHSFYDWVVFHCERDREWVCECVCTLHLLYSFIYWWTFRFLPYLLCVSVLSLVLLFVTSSLRPHRLYPSRLLFPWNSPGKYIGVGCHALLQGIFRTQGLNPVPRIAGRFLTIWGKPRSPKRLLFPLLHYFFIEVYVSSNIK